MKSFVDFYCGGSNNPPMPRPDAVRRVKSYSAADGYVYQYYFFEGNRAQRHGRPGGEYTYVVSANRRTAFPFKIFIMQSVLDAWAKQNGRPLTSSEEYAVAKMRLFVLLMKVPYRPHRKASNPGKCSSTNPTLKSCSDNWASKTHHRGRPSNTEPIWRRRRLVRCTGGRAFEARAR